MAESGASVVGGEVPVDLALVGVGRVLAGGEFGVEDVEVIDAAVEALAGQGGEFDLGDVEPGPVFGGVVELRALREGERPLRGECLVERGDGVGVEVVHHQHHLLGLGIVHGQEPFDLLGPVHPGPAGLGVHAPPPA